MMQPAPSAAMLNPERIFQTLLGYQQTAALKAAIETELFTAIGEGANTITAIAKRTKSNERGIRILLDGMTVYGFLEKSGTGADATYALVPEAAMFLDKKSPAYIGSAAVFLTGEMVTTGFKTFTEAVRKGGTAIDEQGSMAPEHPAWVDFARSMMALVVPSAEFIAKTLHPKLETMKGAHVLDIAAGHGIFGVTLAKHFPTLRVDAVDWPKVLEVARENAKKFGVGDRWQGKSGSAFDVTLGHSYDVVLLTNFLHHFDEPTNVKLLKKMFAALKPGGTVVILEFVPNDDRVSPANAATFSMVMLASTAHGDAYTLEQYRQMLASAGFGGVELRPVPTGFGALVLATKP